MSSTIFAPKPMEYYADLTNGGEYQLTLNQQEACIALKVYDYGIVNLSEDEKQALYSLMGKLKDHIWP